MKALVLAGLFVASAAAAQEAAPPAPAPDNKETAEKKICRTEKMTGSRIRVTRTCLTAQQWSRLAEVTQRDLKPIMDDANRGSAGGPAAAQPAP